MKWRLTVLAMVISAAVSQMAMAAVSFTISADKKTADFAFDASHREQVLYFAYGNANGGDSTNGWEHVEKIADIAAQATEAKDVSLPEGCGTAWGICRAFLLNAGTAKDYAKQDNLVVQYDGIENAGYGTHATTLTSWKDLKGGHDLPLLSGDTVLEKSVKLTKDAHTTTENIISSYQALFFEVASTSARSTRVDPAQQLVSVPRVGSLCAWYQQGFFYTAIPYLEGSTWKMVAQTCNGTADVASFTDNFHTKSAWMNSQIAKSRGGAAPVRYVDGASKAYKWDNGVNAPALDECPSALTLTLSGSTVLTTTYRAVRVYNVQLTAAEVAQNAAIDKARFNNGALVIFHWSETKAINCPFTVKKLTKAADGKTPVSAELMFTSGDEVRKLYIAYGRQDGGEDPSAWVGSAYVCDIPADTSAATVTIPDEAATYLAQKGGYRFLLSRRATAKDYVRQDNLVVQYDAIENAGYGTHATTLTSWKDLKGGHDLPLLSGDTVSADSVAMTTDAHTTTEDIIPSYQKLFFEVLSSSVNTTRIDPPCSVISVPRVGSLCLWYQQGFLCTSIPFYDGNKWMLVDKTANAAGEQASIQNLHTKSAWMEASTGKSKGGAAIVAYIDGANKAHKWDNGSGEGLEECPSELTLTLSGTTKLKTTYRAVRVYNVQLSAAEVARNAAIDKERFNGGTPVFFDATDFARANNFGLIIVVE